MAGHLILISLEVTTDPAARNEPIREGAGAVANDSLAAESTRAGGGFSQNRDSEPLGVKGGNSTFTTTDTSGARKLPPTTDASHRGEPAEQKRYPEGLGGQPDFPGAHVPTTGYVGGASGSNEQQGHGVYNASAKIQESDDNSQGTSNAGTAPSYVATQTQSMGSTKPKGANLKEGVDIDDSNNASWTTDIGSENDPGRLAANQFKHSGSGSATSATGGPRQTELEKDSQPYAPLQAEQEA
ncbi:hypothetical protein F5884DRAFT_267068 [Xylogone sp. PMI_703]|nr:hypothetical protein F5884DRAFT_267068 [Xylogone sp. PMI_703]